MSTQTERTEAVWAAINRDATEVGETEAQLLAHARELALRLDAVMEVADAFLNDGMRDEFRKIISGEAELTQLIGNAEFHCFKKSGKWYSSDRGNLTQDVFSLYTAPAMREQILKDNDGKFPGLSTDGAGFIWVVVNDKHCYGWPLLLDS